jgi:hypothetical protein
MTTRPLGSNWATQTQFERLSRQSPGAWRLAGAAPDLAYRPSDSDPTSEFHAHGFLDKFGIVQKAWASRSEVAPSPMPDSRIQMNRSVQPRTSGVTRGINGSGNGGSAIRNDKHASIPRSGKI